MKRVCLSAFALYGWIAVSIQPHLFVPVQRLTYAFKGSKGSKSGRERVAQILKVRDNSGFTALERARSPEVAAILSSWTERLESQYSREKNEKDDI